MGFKIMDKKGRPRCPNCKSEKLETFTTRTFDSWYRVCNSCGWKSETFKINSEEWDD